MIGVDSVPERLEVARRHGAEVVDFREVQDVDDVVLDLTDGRGSTRGSMRWGWRGRDRPWTPCCRGRSFSQTG